jgi:DnaK suppressor protein
MDEKLIAFCKHKLLEEKALILNGMHTHMADFREHFAQSANTGDEADQTQLTVGENQLFATQQRLRQRLSAVQSALARIESGDFGLCEETLEPIEPERLRLIPWTTLSLEGAELRESREKLTGRRRHFGSDGTVG